MCTSALAEVEKYIEGGSRVESAEDELDFSGERRGFPLAHLRKSKGGRKLKRRLKARDARSLKWLILSGHTGSGIDPATY